MKRTVFSVITAVLCVVMAAAVFMNLFHFTGTGLNGDYGLLPVPGLAAHDAFFEGKGVTAIIMAVLLALSAIGGLCAAVLAMVKKKDKALQASAALSAVYLLGHIFYTADIFRSFFVIFFTFRLFFFDINADNFKILRFIGYAAVRKSLFKPQ